MFQKGRRYLTDKICEIPSNRQLTDNKGNFPKQSVVRQQLSASLILTLTPYYIPNLNLIGKRQEARGKYVTAAAAVSIKWRFRIIHFCRSSKAPSFKMLNKKFLYFHSACIDHICYFNIPYFGHDSRQFINKLQNVINSKLKLTLKTNPVNEIF